MSKSGTTRVDVKPGEPLPGGHTDWRVLTSRLMQVVAAALSDPDAKPPHPRGTAKDAPTAARQGAAAAPRNDPGGIRRSVPPAHHNFAGLGATPKHARCAGARVVVGC